MHTTPSGESRGGRSCGTGSRGGRSRGTGRRRARIAALAALPALLGSECRFALGADDLPVREIVVVPSVVDLTPGGLAAVEALGRDQLGGGVDVRVSWRSEDEGIASVSPTFGSHTVIRAMAVGRTRIVARHRSSGARDTVEVRVTAASTRARGHVHAR